MTRWHQRLWTIGLEWGICLCYTAMFTAGFLSKRDGIPLGLSVVTILLVGCIVPSQLRSKNHRRRGWLLGSAIVALSVFVLIYLWGPSLLMVTTPLISFLYVQRLLRVFDHPAQLALGTYQWETILVPLALIGIGFLKTLLTWAAPSPPGLVPLVVGLFIVLRVASLIYHFRMHTSTEADSNDRAQWYRSLLVTIASLFLGMTVILVLAGIVLAIIVLVQLVSLGTIVNIPIAREIAHLIPTRVMWFIAVGAIVWMTFLKALFDSGFRIFRRGPAAFPWFSRSAQPVDLRRTSFHVQQDRQRWKKPMLLLRVADFSVWRDYQAMIRLLERKGYPLRPEETPREYAERMTQVAWGRERRSIVGAIRELTGAYESTRYSPSTWQETNVQSRAKLEYRRLRRSLAQQHASSR